MFRHKHRRSALIHELQMEVHDHHNRLDRATNGMSPAFVPTSGELVRIDEEHDRLIAIRDAVLQLMHDWSIHDPREALLSVKQRRGLLSEAIQDARERRDALGLTAEKQAAWQSLIDYLRAKRSCSCTEDGQTHALQYSTLGQDFGYALRVCVP